MDNLSGYANRPSISVVPQDISLFQRCNFDRVVVLKAGKIIEDGPPDRLMQGQGPYRELVTQEMSRLAKYAA